MTTKAITAFVDHPSEWNTTCTVQPMEKVTETSNLMISQSISTIFDQKVTFRLRNTVEISYTIRKITQIAEFSVDISGAIQFHQISGHGNPQYDSER